jgi:hypothetical protein
MTDTAAQSEEQISPLGGTLQEKTSKHDEEHDGNAPMDAVKSLSLSEERKLLRRIDVAIVPYASL